MLAGLPHLQPLTHADDRRQPVPERRPRLGGHHLVILPVQRPALGRRDGRHSLCDRFDRDNFKMLGGDRCRRDIFKVRRDGLGRARFSNMLRSRREHGCCGLCGSLDCAERLGRQL